MRIKINTNHIVKKLSAISCKLSAFRNLKPKTYHLKPTRGFTLAELLVTLSLFVVLTTIVLFGNSKFNGSILLTNLAYDVALTIRQAQTYGVNVREDTENDSFENAYGVHFDTQNNREKQFLLFSDSSGRDGVYNGNWDCSGNGGDECLNNYSIKRGNYISNIRLTSSHPSCSPECSVNSLDITFLRPNPDARFYSPGRQNITEAKIIISSVDGNTRTVVVNATGQISIQKN